MSRKTVGQTAAALSVIASLLLVAYELRQNTAVAQMEAYNSFVAGLSAHAFGLSSDPIVAPLIVRVEEGAMPADFTSEERFRIRLNYVGLLRLWEGLFTSVSTNILPESALEVVGQGGAFGNDYFRTIWPELRPAYSAEFVAFFEALSWATS